MESSGEHRICVHAASVEAAADPPQAPPPPPSPATAASAPVLVPMASVEAAATPSQAPPPSDLRRAADAVAMVVTCGFLASLWVCSAANAAFLAARSAYGEASPAALATKEVAVFFSVLMGLFLHAVVLMCLSLC